MMGLFASHQDFNSDISNWNVENVLDMNYMFIECKNFNCDLSKWNMKNVLDTSFMFFGCINFNCDLSNWNMKNVLDMSFMFFGCINFNSDLSNWNVENVTDMSFMFFGCINFNSDLSNWNLSMVKNKKFMFYHCSCKNGNEDILIVNNFTLEQSILILTYCYIFSSILCKKISYVLSTNRYYILKLCNIMKTELNEKIEININSLSIQNYNDESTNIKQIF